ncbi:hypothetical protein QMK33_16910 [Hymenobacter sp. H14-R3]|uniref:hypothetical protein n=1 Tax=Hymenobacter sp. H14-R3 TaxID=3046308 RepID=UPI0024BA8DD9|nr:hypothetical protein [Hymenobacter sp. H14-R3]MDJ0366836.1 hypothetical protein [Hymenobacter sp. H14-R3]
MIKSLLAALAATLDLRQATEVSSVRSTFLQKPEDKIVLPTSLKVAVSTDDRTYKTVCSAPVSAAPVGGSIGEVRANWEKIRPGLGASRPKTCGPKRPPRGPGNQLPGCLPMSWWCDKPPRPRSLRASFAQLISQPAILCPK